ncbi:MAG: ORF6N domain-containing protein [Bacteroidales bacterium]|nr:ORF6N domain-containing protein [Bacteroidales bacterium]
MSADELSIRKMIIEIRGVRVILDRDIAKLYGVTTGNLNKAVKRNMDRFPERYMFQLSHDEFLLFQNGISSWGGTRTLPYAFTEQGVAMLSSGLHSPTAIQVSISIIDAFVALRAFVADNQLLRNEVKNIELQLKLLQSEQNQNLEAINDLSEDVRKEIADIYQAIAELSIKLNENKSTPRPKIGFKINDEPDSRSSRE